jgi:hypothetical protein
MRARLFAFSPFSFPSSSSFLAPGLRTRHRQICAPTTGRESTLIRADQYACAYLLSCRSPCTFDSEILSLLKGRRTSLSFVYLLCSIPYGRVDRVDFPWKCPCSLQPLSSIPWIRSSLQRGQACLDFEGRSTHTHTPSVSTRGSMVARLCGVMPYSLRRFRFERIRADRRPSNPALSTNLYTFQTRCDTLSQTQPWD